MLRASCQCGTVVIEVARKPAELTACNCTLCVRYGALWAYYTDESARVVRGKRKLGSYSKPGGHLAFHHCTVCGCITHWYAAKGKPSDGRIGVNARLLDPKLLASIPISVLDGAATWTRLGRRRAQPDLFVSPKA
jgi:hypothetical protein